MQVAETIERVEPRAASAGMPSIAKWTLTPAYAAILALALSIWFLAIRSPLWLDETWSYWQIGAGFSHIWSRQYLVFPAYSYILWAWATVFGTSEVALRTLSVLAMAGAAAALYRAARELLGSDRRGRDAALIATVLFCIHPITVFESIDARPYALAVLAVNVAILLLVRLRRSHSLPLAAAFGFSAASILHFHYLYGVVLPALLLAFFLVKSGPESPSPRAKWRQLGIALAVFALALLPAIPGLHYLFATRQNDVSQLAPRFTDLLWTLIGYGCLPILAALAATAALIAAALKPGPTAPPAKSRPAAAAENRLPPRLCALLALVPLLLLFTVSVATPIHIFASRYQLAAVPGIALSWGWLIGRLRPAILRPLFCAALVAIVAHQSLHTPSARAHGYTWKYALAFVQKTAAPHEPVVVCSDFVESNFSPMPPTGAQQSIKTSRFFAPLSYYKINAPVVPLPEDLNPEAIRDASAFLQGAAQSRQRFLALQENKPYPTLDWLSHAPPANFDVRNLGTFDHVKILEFIPRP